MKGGSVIVLDNSVLSAFTKIERFDLLRKILGGCVVYIANTVFREIIHQEVRDAIAVGEEKTDNKWITMEVINIEDIKDTHIDEGEKGTIKLALKKQGIAVIDDLDGRKLAVKYKVRTIGTLALLKLAYNKNLISKSELISILDDLETKDSFRITKELKNVILE